MSLLSWFNPPRRLLALFLVVTLLPAAGLIWMGWRLYRQDRALASERLRERRELAADQIATALQKRLAEAEQSLAEAPESENAAPADDAVVVLFKPDSVEAFPKGRLLYYPYLPEHQEAPESIFSRGETYEFQSRNYSKAIAAFQELLHSKDPMVRAGALLRIARNQRKAGQPEAAFASYRELAQFESVTLSGVPAGLVARRARCALLAELGREEDLEQEAGELYTDLQNGRWELERSVYEIHTREASKWLGGNRKTDADRLALAEGVAWLWERLPALSEGSEDFFGQSSIEMESRPLTLLWKGSPGRFAALVAGPHCIRQLWLYSLQPILRNQGVQMAIRNGDGGFVMGQTFRANEPQTLRAASETGLPWTLIVSNTDSQADLEGFAARRRLLMMSLAMVVILISAGGYFIARAFARELAAARLQTDFVAAVSHEFRTPLASLRQLTENLTEGRVTTEERRQAYYNAQARATGRLHRLVEGLLDFGRMEAGVLRYRFETLDMSPLVQSIAEEFQQTVAELGYTVETSLDQNPCLVNGDREALGRALWNLLDNAIKYSPHNRTIRLEMKHEDNRLAIAVRDRGLGIPEEEQKKIFSKFFRGSASKATGIKGTGIGLAMVLHIVRAHGGEIAVESTPGRGSTFVLVLPIIEE
jgi:signal transduction histidine kinase